VRSRWPRTLWGRVLASTVAAVIAAEVLTIASFTGLVLVPEMRRIARATAESVVAVADAAAEVGPAGRARLIGHLERSGWLELRDDADVPDDGGGRPLLVERVFMTALADALGPRGDLYWRTDVLGKLWVHIAIGDRGYWVSIRTLPRLGILGLFAICALASAAISAVVATSFTRKLLKPLTELRVASERATLVDLPGDLPEAGPRDLAAVTRSFNGMMRRLQDADNERRMVLAGISHDVRTPLTKLRLALSMMHAEDRALMDSAERQIDAMERILSQFLTFARGFAAEPVATIAVGDLLAEFDARYGADGVVVEPPPAGATLRGRPEALRRALANLIDNALRYGAAPVRLGVDVRDERIGFVVSDAGDGIAPEEVDRLRQPFVRGDSARCADGTGTGLGLAIVDEIARLHGGEVVYARANGRFRATLDLPRDGA